LKDLRAKVLTLLSALVLAVILILAVVFMMRTGTQQTTVEVIPAHYTVPSVGLNLSINVTVQNVKGLYAYGFELYYPRDMLNGTRVTQAPFLKAGGVSTLFRVVNFTDNFNATNGFINVFCTRSGNVPGVNGSGTLVTITFRSTSANGPKTLHLANVELANSSIAAIPCTAVDGEVTVT
jgi:hypothetical protein